MGKPVTGVPELARRLERFAPLLLVAVTLLAYLPSLSGGWLNWDDPWLIRDNPLLRRSDLGALAAIWTDLSKPTRLALGAEYLPIRDSELWLETRLFGLSPAVLRATNLAFYVGAVLAFRAALRRALPSRAGAEIAAWIFALHPAHVESVAWLAGRKDVLALLFVGLALFVHSGSRTGSARRRLWLVPLLLVCAHLSKSMTITALGLMLALDLVMKRTPERKLYLGALAVALLSLAFHVWVGRVVGMTEPPAGGSRFAQLVTMGPVFLRYLGLLVWPGALSLVHDVPVRTAFDLPALAGYFTLAGWALLGFVAWRRRAQPMPLSAWLWFLVPLLPVSQVLFPLQNQMADRYLFLSVMAPALLAAWAVERAPRIGIAISAVAVVGFTLASAERSALFGDSAAVFADATAKTELSPTAPYQLGRALEEQADDRGAIESYAEALRRSGGHGETGRRATNNFAKLAARAGRLGEAEALLRKGREGWPDDPKILANLAEVVRRQGRAAEADALAAELARRFPDYARQRDNTD